MSSHCCQLTSAYTEVDEKAVVKAAAITRRELQELLDE